MFAFPQDAAKVMSTTSGEADPAYATTMTSAVMTDAAGATMLVPLSRCHCRLT